MAEYSDTNYYEVQIDDIAAGGGYGDMQDYLSDMAALANTTLGNAERAEAAAEDAEASKEYLEDLKNGIEPAVDAWLDEHPEATTTVVDRSLDRNKLILGTMGYVMPEMFGALGDGIHDDTSAIQQAFDSGVGVVAFCSGKTYLVSKANNPALYPDGDEPCIYLNNKERMVIAGNGATLLVGTHGQGVLEVVESEDVVIKDLCVSGYGSFPSIAPTGRGEKGTPTGGYYKEGYDWESHKNNSVDTSAYKGVNGDSTVSWGTFGNGFIGNAGIGILVEKGCERIKIENCSADGFNYSGISVGFRGHSDYEYNRDIIISNCHISNCYDNGINLLLVDGVTIENSFIENIGHPDSRPTSESDIPLYTSPDPGYGITCRKPYTSESRAKNVKVINNIIEKCARKGVDSHSVDELVVKHNKIRLCYVAGIEMTSISAERTVSYNVIVESNILEYCGVLGNAFRYTIDTNNDSFDPNQYDVNVMVFGNIFKKCSATSLNGILYVRVGKNTTIFNNIISDVWALTSGKIRGIQAGNDERISESIKIVGNTISSGDDSIAYPILVHNLRYGIVANNTANVAACEQVLNVAGALINYVTIVGNNMYATAYNSAPSISGTTGKIEGNNLSGSLRGQKLIKGTYTFANGATTISDVFITSKSVVMVSKPYVSGQALNLMFTTQPRNNGSVSIYVRDGSGAQVNGDLTISVLIINDFDS